MNKYIIYCFILLACSSIALFTSWHHKAQSQPTDLVDFVYERDIEDVIKLFDDNWYWMFPEPKEEYPKDYVRYVFKYKAPQANPLFHAKLTIKVIREINHVVAVVGYYMEAKQVGRLLYVLVDKNARGKRYGEKLARHAVTELLNTYKADRVNLVTRIDNAPAQHIYKKIGFRQVRDDGDGLVHFSYFRS